LRQYSGESAAEWEGWTCPDDEKERINKLRSPDKREYNPDEDENWGKDEPK
jgi:hypothetical protein